MNIQLSDFTVALLSLVILVGMAIRYRRSLKLRVSPKSLELDLQSPQEPVAEAGLEPARELPPTGF